MLRNQHVRFGGGRLETQVKLCAGRLPYFLLFSDQKAQCHAWKKAIIAFLADLRLKLHEERAAVYPVQTGIPFLGFRIYPDHRRLKRRNGVAFRRRFVRLCRLKKIGAVTAAHFRAALQGWIAHAQHGDTWGLRRALISSTIVEEVDVSIADFQQNI